MPKATVDEYRKAHDGENDVGPNTTAAEIQAKVLPKTETSAVQRGAKGNLRLRVSTAIRSHGRGRVATGRNG